MDMKLELVPLPVTDVDRAKSFYSEKLGFTVDVDDRPAAFAWFNSHRRDLDALSASAPVWTRARGRLELFAPCTWSSRTSQPSEQSWLVAALRSVK